MRGGGVSEMLRLLLPYMRGQGSTPRGSSCGRAMSSSRLRSASKYPAHAAFGGYKISGVGRENHRMMLDHYSQTKCMLVSYDRKAMGFF
jgi:hypothetical protein